MLTILSVLCYAGSVWSAGAYISFCRGLDEYDDGPTGAMLPLIGSIILFAAATFLQVVA